MSTTLQPYLENIRRTMEAALCLENFSSQVVERHNKPEVEVRTSKELLLQPVIIARNKQERVLIEGSINSVRISIAVKQADEIERILCHKFTNFMTQRADNFVVLRRKPVPGYDISFLITYAHLESMYKHKVIDFLIHFMQEIDKEINEMKLALNARARTSAEDDDSTCSRSCCSPSVAWAEPPVELTQVQQFSIEGNAQLAPDMPVPPNWQANSRVLLDYGKHIGFLREDGSFVVEGVPSGSYVLEVTNVDYIFEPIRVDINSKGKIRARRLNILQPNAVHTLPYPLRLQARQPTKYFRQREQWRATDVLMNPMVLMLLVAFVLMVVTPRLAASDPQLQKELQQGMQMPKVEMPRHGRHDVQLLRRRRRAQEARHPGQDEVQPARRR
ncbi:DUF2012 domain-containing protein [Aphelenchoides fujianensis]|nr:DUF2012 domain-containing protein [Aphelenchoides fujianensis]